MKKLNVINKTCFQVHEELQVSCEKKECSNWIKSENNQNCAVISSQFGPRTLQEVGEFFNLTRMRICQIEKNIQRKLRLEEV